MINELKNQSNVTYTENGAITDKSTYSDCLNFFAIAGSIRSWDKDEVITLFNKAYIENADLALKTLFYVRDVRGGIGERRIFRDIIKSLAFTNNESLKKNLSLIPEYGRYDDLLELLETPLQSDVIEIIKNQLNDDFNSLREGNSPSLLSKWLPSINASNGKTIHNAKIICNGLGMSCAEYRKTLTALRNSIKIIENNLREIDYSFDYSKQPSRAMFKYRKAFERNDFERYQAYLDNVNSGKAKLNASALTPYDIVESIFDDCRTTKLSPTERKSICATWNALEDFTNDENALVIVDGSGSMYEQYKPRPISVAVSLGIYYAERCKGEFHNHFITFSETPTLVEIKGKDIVDKVRYCCMYNEVANTNISAVFKLILDTAVKHKIPQEEMPTKLYVISDMEFDCCADDAELTNFEYAKKLFNDQGYNLPQIVFWNVCAHSKHYPVTMNESKVALVSGCSPKIFFIVTTGDFNPYSIMMDTLNSERYAAIKS